MGAGVWRAVQTTAKGLKPPRQCSQPGSLNPGATLGSDGMVKRLNTRKRRHRKQATRGCSRLEPKGMRSGSGSRTWPDANVAPPVYRVDLTRPVVDAEHGKAVTVHPALAGPRQADRKAGPGEAALRGSKKPRPLCNGSDMPTSIWSFVVRKSMEPFLLRKANDDRRLSISASQARHKDCRGARPSISMAKVESGPKRSLRRACPAGTPRTEWCPLKGLSRGEGKLSCTVLRGA
jgi:hypothetical protein